MRKILIFLFWFIFFSSCFALTGETWFDPNDQAGYFVSNYEVDLDITNTWILNVVEIIKANLTRYRIWPVRLVPSSYSPPDISFFQNFEKKIFDIKLDQIRVAWFRYLPLFLKWVRNIRIGEDEDYAKWNKQYIINYEVHNAINKTSNHAEFFWNIVPDNWDSRINSVNFKIKLPKNITLNDKNAYVFYKKDWKINTLQNIQYWSNFISWTLTEQLKPWENIGIWIIFPKDYFKNDLKWNFNFFVKTNIWTIITWVLIIFAIFTWIVVFSTKDKEPPLTK